MSAVLGVALPHHWSAAPLKHVTSVLSRGTAPNYVDAGPVRAISQASNQLAGIDWRRTRFHDYDGSFSGLRGRLQEGDVLVNSTGTGTLGRVGYFSEAPDGAPCMADSHVTLARAEPGLLDSRFLYYWLGSGTFQAYLQVVLAVGATNQTELNRDRLGEALTPLPPRGEQIRIAEFLDAETVRIDRLLGLREGQEARLEERRYASLSESLLPGTLDHSPGGSMYSWLPDSSDGPPLVKLGYLCRIQNGLTVDGARNLAGDVVTRPYLRVANVQAGRLELDSVSEITVPRAVADRCTLRRGDVLMTEGGDLDKLGRGAVWGGEIPDCLHQNHVFVLRPDSAVLDARYLSLLTQTLHGRCYFESTGSKTTNLASTNSRKILSFPVPLPAIERQKELVAQAEEGARVIAEARALLRRQRALLAERRQALITAAVTGQFDVSTASGRNVTDVTDGVTRV